MSGRYYLDSGTAPRPGAALGVLVLDGRKNDCGVSGHR